MKYSQLECQSCAATKMKMGGSKWFLEKLDTSIKVLVMDHPKSMARMFKYLHPSSDRMKGLINPLTPEIICVSAIYPRLFLEV